MVHDHHGDVLLLAQSEQPGTDQWSARQVKGPLRLPRGCESAACVCRSSSGRPLRSSRSSGNSSTGGDDLARDPSSATSVVRSTSCRRTTSFKRPTREPERRAGPRARQPPECYRTRGPVPVDRGTKAAACAKEAGSEAPRWTRVSGGVWGTEPSANAFRRCPPIARWSDLRGNLSGMCRLQTSGGAGPEAERPAASGLRARRNCREHRPVHRRAARSRSRQGPLRWVPGVVRSGHSPRACAPAGSGRAWRSIFPLGVSGRDSRITNAVGTMYSGTRPRSHRRRSAVVMGSRPWRGTM